MNEMVIIRGMLDTEPSLDDSYTRFCLEQNGFSLEKPIEVEEVPNGVKFTQQLSPLNYVTIKGNINI